MIAKSFHHLAFYLLHQQGIYIVISIHMAKLKIPNQQQPKRTEKERTILNTKKDKYKALNLGFGKHANTVNI